MVESYSGIHALADFIRDVTKYQHPLRPLNRRAGSNHWDTLPLVLDIEPLGFPVDYFTTKTIRDINSIVSLSKMKTCTSYYI